MVIKTQADFYKALTWLQKQEKVAYDIETNSLDYRDPNSCIIGIGVSNFSSGFYLPLYNFSVDDGKLIATEVGKFAQAFVQEISKKDLITFNGAFDLPWTKAKLGVDLVPKLHTDVLLLKHTVDEEFPFKLKEIAVQVFGYGAAQQQRDLQEQLKERDAAKGEIYKADYELVGKYCIQDCVLTYKLFEHYSRKLAAEKLEDFFYKHEVMPLYREVTLPMEAHGIALDLPLMQTALAEITADITKIEVEIQAEIEPLLDQVFKPWFMQKDYPPTRSGAFAQAYCELYLLPLPKTDAGKYSLAAKALSSLPDQFAHQRAVLQKEELMTNDEIAAVQALLCKQEHGTNNLFNLQSKHHLKKLFFDTLGLTPLSTTDLGNPQVDDNFIDSVSDKYAWAAKLHVFNRLQKIRSTYIERFLEGQNNGIFYPSFFQHRTVSGRLAGDFQQLPRPIEDGHEHPTVLKYNNLIRKFFIARPGKIFVDADYNSAEPRVFAFVSGDQGLKDIFQQGYDFYSHIAIMTESLQGVSSHKKADNYLGKLNPSKRQEAKAYSLGTPYGLTGYKLSFQLGCTPEEGDQLINNYLNAFPNLRKWMQTTQQMVVEQGYVRTLGGRIRHLPRAKEYVRKFGLSILDSLHLYKEYGKDPGIYAHMKTIRKELKNLINNGNNVQIQATVASIINRASIEIAREFKLKGLDAHISAQIHDQLIVECGLDIKTQVAEIVQRNMESAVKLFVTDVPIPAEPNFGYNLKESKGA